VVGSRKISEYGKKAIDRVVPDIAKIFPIVSGGAAGCDSYAHVSAMNA
jgi:DNA processing protein